MAPGTRARPKADSSSSVKPAAIDGAEAAVLFDARSLANHGAGAADREELAQQVQGIDHRDAHALGKLIEQVFTWRRSEAWRRGRSLVVSSVRSRPTG
jgi:hypothetical protein